MRINLPGLEEQILAIKEKYRQIYADSQRNIDIVISPYRICPLGAHVDHQGGRVLGFAINAYSILAYQSTESDVVLMESENYPGSDTYLIGQEGDADMTQWSRYLRGASSVLHQHYSIQSGIRGLVVGTLPGSGLSSSASVGLAYLHGLAQINGLDIDSESFIRYDLQLENAYLGLEVGILDPAMIQLSKREHLLYVDTLKFTYDWVPNPPLSQKYCFLVIYSGLSRELSSTGFNDRVGECYAAARMLGSLGDVVGAKILSDIPVEVFNRFRSKLPGNLTKRAAHYFSEVDRADAGKAAWEQGELEEFGEYLNQSCHSSITQYESGNRTIIRLHELMSGTSGVLGSRFGGGGYGGCVFGLVEREKAERIAELVMEVYLREFPEMEGRAHVFIAEQEGGVRLQ